MANQIKELRLDIATSILVVPCTEDELISRDFLKCYSKESVQRILQRLENDGAIYYRGDKMYISKNWARKNLDEF